MFKMDMSCYDETTTEDDDETTTGAGGGGDGKFDKLEDSEYVADGVMLVGFTKTWDEKEKVEKKYEEFFCKLLMEFFVEYDVELDWTLVDGPSEVNVVEEDGVVVEESVEGGANTTVIEEEVGDVSTNSTMTTVAPSANSTDVNNTDVNNTETEDIDWNLISNLAYTANAADDVEETTTTSTMSPPAVVEEGEEATSTNTASEINAADTSFVQSINQQSNDDPSSSSSTFDKIPLGGWIGIGLGGILLAFLLAALIVSKKRRNHRRNNTARDHNNDDNGSIWSDDEETNMMQGAGKGVSSPMSGVAAIGMASTVATRLTTGDTEVTLMKKQLWTEREPVV